MVANHLPGPTEQSKAVSAMDAVRTMGAFIGDKDADEFAHDEVLCAATRHWFSTIGRWARQESDSVKTALCSQGCAELALVLEDDIAPHGWWEVAENTFAPLCSACEGYGVTGDTRQYSTLCRVCDGAGFRDSAAVDATPDMGDEFRRAQASPTPDVLWRAARNIDHVVLHISNALTRGRETSKPTIAESKALSR